LNRCPECGWEYIKTAREIAQEKGEYDNGDDSKRREKFLEWHQEALDKGYKSGYASVKFRRLYGRWPQKKWIRTAAGLSSKDQYVNLDEVERLEAEVS
jgi:hypothetical protein